MREMYIILGWVGWIWLGIVMILLPAGLWIQHLRRRNTGEGEAPSREGEAPSEPSFPPSEPTTR